MRAAADANNYKRFHGSSFLSDFTLIISVDGEDLHGQNNGRHPAGQGHTEAGQASDALLVGCQDTYATPESSPRKLEVEQADTCSELNDQLRTGLTINTLSTGLASKPSLRVPVGNYGSSRSLLGRQLLASCYDESRCWRMPVHAIVLAAASPFFETLLRDWKDNLNNEIQMVVEEEQVEAAKALISFMYNGTIPAGIPQQDLLNIILLADKYDVKRCLEAAGQALGALSASALEWPSLLAIASLPDHLYESDALAAARAVAAERQQQLFSDLEATWATADGRSKWRQLPVRAILQLAASDALCLASENTLFAAIASWVATSGITATAEELQLLAASIRLPYITPGYLSFVVMQHAWFRTAVDPVVLARAAAFAAASPDVRKDLIQYTASTLTSPPPTSSSASLSSSQRPPTAAAAVPPPPPAITHPLPPHHPPFISSGGSGTSTPGATNGVAAIYTSSTGGSYGGLSSSSSSHLYATLVAAQQRQRASSTTGGPRSHTFQWQVDVAAVQQLYEEVAAAGSRDSRLLRSPAHYFGGYEWALQLEVTQTKGATGFDGSKPWALGVFLTCQVRAEVPAGQNLGGGSSSSVMNSSSRLGTVPVLAVAAAGGGFEQLSGSNSCYCSHCAGNFGAGVRVDSPDGQDRALAAAAAVLSSGSGSMTSSGLCRGCGSRLTSSRTITVGGSSPLLEGHQQQQDKAAALAAAEAATAAAACPVQIQQLDFGIVATAATISAREAVGGRDKRWEKSWEHGVVSEGRVKEEPLIGIL